MEKSAKIFVTGHRGMVGSAIVRRLYTEGFGNIMTCTRTESDLLDQRAVTDLLSVERPDYIVIAAAKVGDVIIEVDPRCYRPTEVETLLGDPTKAKQTLGWTPKTTLQELVKEMVESDYLSAKRDNLVKQAGFQSYDYHE